jgi:hypothetical protein
MGIALLQIEAARKSFEIGRAPGDGAPALKMLGRTEAIC